MTDLCQFVHECNLQLRSYRVRRESHYTRPSSILLEEYRSRIILARGADRDRPEKDILEVVLKHCLEYSAKEIRVIIFIPGNDEPYSEKALREARDEKGKHFTIFRNLPKDTDLLVRFAV